jgi:hypothetical protein
MHDERPPRSSIPALEKRSGVRASKTRTDGLLLTGSAQHGIAEQCRSPTEGAVSCRAADTLAADDSEESEPWLMSHLLRQAIASVVAGAANAPECRPE